MALTPNAAAAQKAALYELQTRPCASFLCSVPDAALTEAGAHRQRIEFASDSCSDVPAPRRAHICWAAHGTMGRFLLQGQWLAAHITLTEGCGPALAVLELAPNYPSDTIVLAADATAATAAQLNKSQALALQIMMRRLKVEDAYRNAVARLFIAHCAGFANILTDAGSRDLMDVVFGVAAAYGLRMRFPPTSAIGLQFMADVISAVAEPSPAHGPAATAGHFILANANARDFSPQPGDILIDRSHPTLGNFLRMENESQRATVCRGFDDVWHRRATVEEAAARAGITPSGRTASASVEQRHAAAAAIANRVLEGEQLRGVCHCAPRMCHGRTILRHVMDLVHAAREPRTPTHGADEHCRSTAHSCSSCSGWRLPHRRQRPQQQGSPTAVHPLFVPLAMGMPPIASLSRSPSPLARRHHTPYAQCHRGSWRWRDGARRWRWPPTRYRHHGSGGRFSKPHPEVSAHAPPTRHSAPRQRSRKSTTTAGRRPRDGPAQAERPHPTRSHSSRPLPTRRPKGDRKGGARQAQRPGRPQTSQADAAATGGEGPPRARWSPQPQSAAAARAAAAGDLAATLANDTSKYAIMQGRPEALADLCEEAAALRNEGAKKGTDKRDTWGYNKVKMVCESAELNSPIMRPRTHDIDTAGRGREAFWAALLVMKLIMVISPCTPV